MSSNKNFSIKAIHLEYFLKNHQGHKCGFLRIRILGIFFEGYRWEFLLIFFRDNQDYKGGFVKAANGAINEDFFQNTFSRP